MRSYSIGRGMNVPLFDFKAKDDSLARLKAIQMKAEYCVRTRGFGGSAMYTVYEREQ